VEAVQGGCEGEDALKGMVPGVVEVGAHRTWHMRLASCMLHGMPTRKVTLTLDETAADWAEQCAKAVGESFSKFASKALRDAAVARWPRPMPSANELAADEQAALLDELEREAGRKLDELADQQARRRAG